jgi:hypothetical protein
MGCAMWNLPRPLRPDVSVNFARGHHFAWTPPALIYSCTILDIEDIVVVWTEFLADIVSSKDTSRAASGVSENTFWISGECHEAPSHSDC